MPFISSVRGSFGPQGRFGRRPGLSGSTGGTYTEAGGYGIHTFDSVGSFSFVSAGAGTVEYIVVAGGGGGGTDQGDQGAGGGTSPGACRCPSRRAAGRPRGRGAAGARAPAGPAHPGGAGRGASAR